MGLVGFYVLVIFDFDGDLNGISCLFCWVYEKRLWWQSLRTSSQSAEPKLDDLPADLEIKIRFFLSFFLDFYSGFHRDFSNEYDGRFIGKIHGIFPGDVISSATFGNQGRGWWWWRRWHFNEGSAGSVYFRVKIWFTMGRLLAMKCHPASSSFGSDEDPGDGRNAVMAVWFNVYYDTYLPVIGWCIV